MSHKFETGFSVKTPMWHKLGKVAEKEIYSTKEALELSSCDWTVSLSDIFVNTGDNIAKKIPHRKAVIRDTDKNILGIVSDRYTPLQNIDAFKFFDPFVHEKDCYIDTAGSLKDGSLVWILANINGGTKEIVKDDPISRYLLLATSHDCSIPLSLTFTDVRVQCYNTLSAALSYTNSTNSIKIKHKGDVHDKLSSIQTSIDLAKADFNNFVDSMKYLQQHDVNINSLKFYLESLFYKEFELAKKNNPDIDFEDLRSTKHILKNFESSEDLQSEGIRGTWYAGFQAVTEYISWQKSSNTSKRLHSIWFGPDSSFLNKARDLAISLV